VNVGQFSGLGEDSTVLSASRLSFRKLHDLLELGKATGCDAAEARQAIWRHFGAAVSDKEIDSATWQKMCPLCCFLWSTLW